MADFTFSDLARIIAILFLTAFYGAVLWSIWESWPHLRSKAFRNSAPKLVFLFLLCVFGAAIRIPGLGWAHDIYTSKMVYGKFMLMPASTNIVNSESSFTGDGTWANVVQLPESYWSWLAEHEFDLIGKYPLGWSPEWETTKWQKTPTTGKALEIANYLSGDGKRHQIGHLIAWAATQEGGYFTYSEDPKKGYRRYVSFRLLIPASKQAVSIFQKI
ncbi:MAG: hypothetical protein IPK32_02535 [Verrucomicrobiaceae bacterium]|nr:hypothetical protein [Verrucomicrobiaceae bacterium]